MALTSEAKERESQDDRIAPEEDGGPSVRM